MNSIHSSRTALSFLWLALKRIVFVLVLFFVAWRAVGLWTSAPPTAIQIQPVWLLCASACYVVGWLPSALIWRALIQSMNQRLELRDALRAYYIGHLGKYVPGKALVIVIRSAMLRDVGIDPLFAGSAVIYETLIFFATGAAWGLALAPSLFGNDFWSRFPIGSEWLRDRPLLFSAIVFACIFASTPLSAWLFSIVGRRVTRQSAVHAQELPSVPAGLICWAVILISCGWACHALSLGFVIRSVVHRPIDFHEFPLWMAATTISTVGGFVVLVAPGGLGVREGLLIEMVKSHEAIGPAMAVVLAALLRATWFVSELFVAAAFYLAKSRR